MCANCIEDNGNILGQSFQTFTEEERGLHSIGVAPRGVHMDSTDW